MSEVKIQTHIINEGAKDKKATLKHIIRKGNEVVKEFSIDINLPNGKEGVTSCNTVSINNPSLWSPANPSLYTLQTIISDESGKEIDSQTNRFGIRKFEFKDNQLYINGEKTYLRGVNRHQEYPYIGYALSDNAQYRDAFLGWQYYAYNDEFRNQCYRSAKQLIRRDRNHPCVLAWEVSLNETKMPIEFMEVLDNIVHKEYPGENVYSCGWMPQVYDIYFQARQHRILHKDEMKFDKPYIVSEYGDWEYYSNNAGLNQHKMPKNMRVEY